MINTQLPVVQLNGYFFYSGFEEKNKKTYTIIVTSVASPPTIVLGKGDYPTLFLSSTI